MLGTGTGKVSIVLQVTPSSALQEIVEVKAPKLAKISRPRIAKDTVNRGRPAPGSTNVHGTWARALRKTPMFAPTTQRVPVQSAVKAASPGANRSLKRRDRVQSGCPGSR